MPQAHFRSAPHFPTKAFPSVSKPVRTFVTPQTIAYLQRPRSRTKPPTFPVFCQSQSLHGVKNDRGICPQEYGGKDEKEMQKTYNDLCGILGPSATVSVPAPTSAPTSTSARSTSISIPLTTSALMPAPIQTSVPPLVEPQSGPDHHENWYIHPDPACVLPLTSDRAHKHLVIIAMFIIGPISGMIARLLFCRWSPALDHWYHNHKPRNRFRKRDPAHIEHVLMKHQRYFEYC